MSQPGYPAGIPGKFDMDGNVQRFLGNTIVSHLSDSTNIYKSLMVLYERLQQSPLSKFYTLLPPSSWHVTIFDGVIDGNRKPGSWPNDLSLGDSLEECNVLYKKKLSSFNLQTDVPYHFSISGFNSLRNNIMFLLKLPNAENLALRDLRNRLSDVLQVRHSNHDIYGFHISMAYMLRYLTDAQETELINLLMDHLEDMPKEMEVGAPEFCRYESMFAFEPLVSLTNAAK